MRGLTAFVLALIISTPQPARTAPAPVQVQMRNVELHVDATTIIRIVQLRGELISTSPTRPPVFDDRRSFKVRVDSGEIAVDAGALTQLLNRYLFSYKGSPLRDLKVTTAEGLLKIEGELRKGVPIPFSMTAEPSVLPDGMLRLHPVTVKTLGIPTKRLMEMFGVELDDLIKLKKANGARLDGDDFILDPAALMPPPRIEGRLQSVRVEGDRIVQRFGPGRLPALKPPDPAAANYMYYAGGVLKFGKLTMTDTDMQLIDDNPGDPFDFSQERYNDQLVAGYSKNTAALGLKVYMPDYHRVAKPRG
jgi:uncharacterized protein YpmS